MTRCQREMSRARSRPRARLDARARCRCRERPCRRRWTGGNRRTSSSRSRPPPGPPRERRHRGRAAGRAESSSLTPAHGHDVACEELIALPATHWLRDCRKRARRRDPVVVGHQVGHLFGHASTVSPDPGTGCNFTTPTAPRGRRATSHYGPCTHRTKAMGHARPGTCCGRTTPPSSFSCSCSSALVAASLRQLGRQLTGALLPSDPALVPASHRIGRGSEPKRAP